MKLAVIASLLASAAAFAPAKQAATSTALNSFESELGVQQPVSSEDLARPMTLFETSVR